MHDGLAVKIYDKYEKENLTESKNKKFKWLKYKIQKEKFLKSMII